MIEHNESSPTEPTPVQQLYELSRAAGLKLELPAYELDDTQPIDMSGLFDEDDLKQRG